MVKGAKENGRNRVAPAAKRDANASHSLTYIIRWKGWPGRQTSFGGLGG